MPLIGMVEMFGEKLDREESIRIMGKRKVVLDAYNRLDDFLRSDKCKRSQEPSCLGSETYFCKINDNVSLVQRVTPYSESPRERDILEYFSKYYIFENGQFVTNPEKAVKVIEKSTGIDLIETKTEYSLDEVMLSFSRENGKHIPEDFEGFTDSDIDDGMFLAKGPDY